MLTSLGALKACGKVLGRQQQLSTLVRSAAYRHDHCHRIQRQQRHCESRSRHVACLLAAVWQLLPLYIFLMMGEGQPTTNAGVPSSPDDELELYYYLALRCSIHARLAIVRTLN